MRTDILCRHCEKFKAQPDRKGLCWSCSQVPAIRDHYASESKFAPARARREETMEDVERIVAEQMQCLPAWWEGEAKKGIGPRT